MIKISLSDDKPNLFQSKFGGVPYLPKDAETPKNKENKQLTLLAQINIEKLPKNNIYPIEEGIPDKVIPILDKLYEALDEE